MDKQQAIMQLRLAKSAHIQWRSYAQALISGIPVEQSQVPVLHTDCKFGKWYYGEGQRLADLTAYAGIETPHEVLHQLYMKIFKLLFDETKSSALGKLFGSASKKAKERKAEADELMHTLVSVSETLLEAIAQLEQEIRDTPEEAFEKF